MWVSPRINADLRGSRISPQRTQGPRRKYLRRVNERGEGLLLSQRELRVRFGEMAEAAQAENLSGQRLGHYVLLEEIGAGAMGRVYRARDERLERDVAIKILPPRSLSDPEARKRFRSERSEER